jgi:protein SCO1/2
VITTQTRLFIIIVVSLTEALTTAFSVAASLPAQSGAVPEELRGILVDEPATLPSFQLRDQQNQPFGPPRFKNAWTFVYFGYTHCPDVCPTTLTAMDDAADQLSKLDTGNHNIQYMFVSIDPDRDNPKSLGEYVKYFNAKFIAATGDTQQLKKLADTLHIKFQRVDITENEYGFNHSSAMLLIDPQARYYARFRAPHYAEKLFTQFRKVLAYNKYDK